MSDAQKHGAHYTQSELADYMASRLDIQQGHRVLDPTCGGGDLLAAVRRSQPEAKIVGVDIRPEAVAETRARMPDADVRCADFLDDPGRYGEFDAVIMNPPFLGGQKISTVLGDAYRKKIMRMHPWAKGPCDLAAHFLIAAAGLVRIGGKLGIIATNTIAQGATRRAGLAHLLDRGWVIYEAQRSIPWPGEAKVKVATVHIVRMK